MVTVVTGAAGHLGGNLVRALLAEGRAVRALDFTRDWSPLAGLDVERVQADIRDPEALRQAFAGADVVYHTAGYISLQMNEWPIVEAINVYGVRNVVQACLDRGVRRLVHFSSIHALRQEPLGVPVDESSPLVTSHRHSPYDRSKAAGEREVQAGIERGLDAVVLNPTGMLGPYDHKPSQIGSVLLAMARGKMPASVNSGFDWVDVRDVAEGALAAERLAPAGRHYILGGQWVSVRDMALLVEEITGVRPPWFTCPMGVALPAARIYSALTRHSGQRQVFTDVSLMALRSNKHISHERATRELGYHPRPFRVTLADTLRWFRSSGKLEARPAAAREKGKAQA